MATWYAHVPLCVCEYVFLSVSVCFHVHANEKVVLILQPITSKFCICQSLEQVSESSEKDSILFCYRWTSPGVTLTLEVLAMACRKRSRN